MTIPVKKGKHIALGDGRVGVALDGNPTVGGVSQGRVIQPGTHPYSDTVLVPSSADGVEVLYVLNDRRAPSQFRSIIDMPTGARLVKTNDYLIQVLSSDGSTLLYISAPWALDAAGNSVDLRLSVAGKDTVVLTVSHRGARGIVYPVLVDPEYDTVFSALANALWCVMVVTPGVCVRAQASANSALSYANQYFPGTVHNGKGDAFRHCYWSARMTIEDGPAAAYLVAQHHEDTAKGQPAIEKDMDMRNNGIGRSVGGGKGSHSEASVRSTCQTRATAGALWTIVDGKLV